MKTITDIYTVYTYSELNEDAKEKAKEWYLNDDFRSEVLTEDFEENFINYFFPNSKLDVQWSLSSCQGDGVNLYGTLDLIDIINYIRGWNVEEHAKYPTHNPQGVLSEKELRRLEFYIKYYQNSVTTATIPCNSRYCYSIANQIDFAWELIEDLQYWNVRDIDENLIERFQDLTISIMTRICKEMEDYGYNYLYEIDDEKMTEFCDANDFYFYEDGRFYG